MRGDFCRNALRLVLRATCGLFLFAVVLRAQDSPGSAPPSASANENSADVRALAASILELKSQLQLVNDQLLQLRREQDQTRAEARDLRRQLDAALGKSHSAGTLPAAPVGYDAPPALPAGMPSSSSDSAAPHPTPVPQEVPDRLSRIEENEQFLDAKISDQYQTKVESSSKYRLRLSGIMLLNVFANRGRVDNQDFPQLAASDDSGIAQGTFGGSLRQSQIGLEAFGPDIAGAHTSADVKFDFAGGFPDTPNGVTTGVVRLRTGTVRMDWGQTSLVAGQDRLFFVPLAPTSLASLAIPPLAYNGNLWSWTPQVRVEHSLHFTESSSLVLQGGILDALTGEDVASQYDRLPTSGESSGQPAYATRLAWRQRSFGQQWTIGFGGYYSRQNWGLGRNVDAWTGTTDLSLPLGRFLSFTGEFYRGRSIGGLGGGIGQSIVLSGSLADPATTVKGLDSMGGWAQLKFKSKTNLEFNGAFGQDNPFAAQLRQFPFAGSYLNKPLARNRSFFLNTVYQLKSDFLLSFEYRHLQTVEIGGDSYNANHLNLSVGYIF